MQRVRDSAKVGVCGQQSACVSEHLCVGVTVVGCAVVQMNYSNKALDLFSTNRWVEVDGLGFGIVLGRISWYGRQLTTHADLRSSLFSFLSVYSE